jgi:group I intron endonuclease
MAYIYKITNTINGKLYIGKTERSLKHRWNTHVQDSKKPSCKHRALYKAFNKYGIENFIMTLLEETSIPEEREVYYIALYNTYIKAKNSNGYNLTTGGDGRAWIDKTKVLMLYKVYKNIAEVSRKLDISVDSVRNILRNNNEHIMSGQVVSAKVKSKPVVMEDKQGLVKQFSSSMEAARYLKELGLANGEERHIASKILDVCNNKRKTAYKQIWLL